MVSQRFIETSVGLFLLAAIAALVVLAFQISGLTSFGATRGYNVTAYFDDVGQLKQRASVKVGGVTIGEVTAITLNSKTFRALVNLHIQNQFNTIPEDSVASILTSGLLGDNYIAISPMYSEKFLHEGSQIQDTHSAMVLEKLIGQMMYKLSNTGNAAAGSTVSAQPAH